MSARWSATCSRLGGMRCSSAGSMSTVTQLCPLSRAPRSRLMTGPVLPAIVVRGQVGGVVAVGPGGAVPAFRVAPGVRLGGVGGAAFAVPDGYAVGGEQVQCRGAGPDERWPVRA